MYAKKKSIKEKDKIMNSKNDATKPLTLWKWLKSTKTNKLYSLHGETTPAHNYRLLMNLDEKHCKAQMLQSSYIIYKWSNEKTQSTVFAG